MTDSSFARQVVYEVLEQHGWSTKRINEAFNEKLVNTDEEEEIRCNLKFLEENFINKDIYLSFYNKRKAATIEKKQKFEDKKLFVEHPKLGRTISEFAAEVANILKTKEKIFFRPDAKEINEVRHIEDENGKESYEGFSTIKPNRFITLIEDYVVPYVLVFNKNEGWIEKKKSISAELASTTLCADIMEQSLPHIRRIFGVPIPIMYNGELTFPKKGYDERFKSWLPDDAPNISNQNMSLQEAKDLFKIIFGEFCFKSEQDFSNALAAFITPFLKGLYSQFNIRSPIFFYLANRERAGKDYLAGITGIVYEGVNLDEPPLCTQERNSNENDEFRKKILSSLKNGRKRLHFQNNKGYLNNPTLEAISTAQVWSDRLLGKNEELKFDNELDISLSGNVGIGYTPDFNNRCRKINLFLDIEDANQRRFTNPNLHQWIKDNRNLILSALYALVRNWIEKGSKEGEVPFASFPEWSKICGGIMESAGYTSPCNPDIDTLGMSGDVETLDMKTLFEVCYAKHPDVELEKQEIIKIIQNSEIDMFPNLNFDERGDQTKFGIRLNKFVGRMLSGILLKIDNIKIRSARQKLTFTKIQDKQQTLSFGNVGIHGNDLQPLGENENEKDKGGIKDTKDTKGYQFASFPVVFLPCSVCSTKENVKLTDELVTFCEKCYNGR